MQLAAAVRINICLNQVFILNFEIGKEPSQVFAYEIEGLRMHQTAVTQPFVIDCVISPNVIFAEEAGALEFCRFTL